MHVEEVSREQNSRRLRRSSDCPLLVVCKCTIRVSISKLPLSSYASHSLLLWLPLALFHALSPVACRSSRHVVPAAASALRMGRGPGHPRGGGARRRHPLRPRLGRDLHAGLASSPPSFYVFVSLILLLCFTFRVCVAFLSACCEFVCE